MNMPRRVRGSPPVNGHGWGIPFVLEYGWASPLSLAPKE
jgi:hypothetical protein